MSLHRRTSAASTKLAIGATFAAYHAGRPPTPQSVIDWVKTLHNSAPARTPHFTCRKKACSDDACCKRELAHSTVGTYLRLLKNSLVGAPHRPVISSLLVRQYLAALKRSQGSAGRYTSPGGTIFEDQAHELFYAAPAVAGPSPETQLASYLALLASLAIMSLDMHAWRRAGEIAGQQHDAIFITTDSDGAQYIHIGLSPDRKIMKSAGLYAGAVQRPGDPTCPIANVRKYLDACALYGVNLESGPRMFPEIVTGADGDPEIRASRAAHNKACKHTYTSHPDHRTPDCHPLCEEWAFPAITTTTVNKWLHKLCAAAEVDTTYNVHTLRSAPVLIMLENGTSGADINALMGWAPNSRMHQVYARTVQFHAINVPRSINVANIRRAMASAAQSRPILPLFRA